MKPFDIEEFKAGAIGITRNGHEVRFVVYVPDAAESHQLVVLTDEGYIERYRNDGGWMNDSTKKCDDDIIGLKPESRVFWVNFYSHDDMSIHHTESEANGFIEERFRINGKAYRVEVEL